MKIDSPTTQQARSTHGDGLQLLTELALNLHWTWNHSADELWKRLDAELWQETQNPWVILQTVSRDTILEALAEPEFRSRLDAISKRNSSSYSANAWFQAKHPAQSKIKVAYFSMEFMLSEALPIYSGGLGQVAGDQMKAASDLGVPVTGVGLLYGQGYFRQEFDSEGRQQVLYPVNDPGQLPIKPLRRPNGEWLRLPIQLPASKVWLRCWEVAVGRSKLYLLDMNDFANTAAQRGICSQLYGGDTEMRLKQELVLGIGGWRLLRALGIAPDVCHLNEGHAAFAVLERARCYMEDNKVPFPLALCATRAGNLFTTHTAVAAGFDKFAPDLMRKFLTHYAQEELGIPIEDLLALGRQDAGDPSESFNMAYLAVHGSGQVNGVSKLHGQVSRHIFQPLFPRWPESEVPIGSVTNGVHVPTWDSEGADALWTGACGKQRWHGESPDTGRIRQLTDQQLWDMRTQGRRTLIGLTRQRYVRELASHGELVSAATGFFVETTLTLGFARRFATYKRPNLLLHDPERLIRLLSSRERPVQLILAGKAHPQDLPGQELVKQWNDFIKRPDVRPHVIFLEDYDMRLAQELVAGVDLWINTPRRPWEACGTSGMKVLANGGLNLSELDGWWAEAYSPDIGWAIGDGKEHGEDAAWDATEAAEMYALLEEEVVPMFYERTDGLPTKWLSRVRESMARLTPEFSASRAIRDYTEEHYLPAALRHTARTANSSKLAESILAWKQDIKQHWSSLSFGSLSTSTSDGQHSFRVEVSAGTLNPLSMRVELYASPLNGGVAALHLMERSTAPEPSNHLCVYLVTIPAVRPVSDYTSRVVPFHEGAMGSLETAEILWQR